VGNGNKLRTSYREGTQHSLTNSPTISKATKIPVPQMYRKSKPLLHHLVSGQYPYGLQFHLLKLKQHQCHGNLIITLHHAAHYVVHYLST